MLKRQDQQWILLFISMPVLSVMEHRDRTIKIIFQKLNWPGVY